MSVSSFLKLVVTPIVEGGLLLATFRSYGWVATLVLFVWWAVANAVRAISQHLEDEGL